MLLYKDSSPTHRWVKLLLNRSPVLQLFGNLPTLSLNPAQMYKI